MGFLDASHPMLLLILFSITLCANSQTFQRGYYWRDYSGIIPRDAIVGGLTENGEPIYIGQVLYYDKLLPAKIYPDDKNGYFAWGNELSSSDNVQILCSPYPEKLKWVDTTKDGLHLLINTHLVKGGSEPIYDTYIGRAFHKWQTLVGRVRAGNIPAYNLGLYITVPGREIILPSFQILTYDPTATATDDTSTCNKQIVLKS